jgi:hypothetical protein
VVLGNNVVGKTLETNIKKEEEDIWKYWKIWPPPKRKKEVKRQQNSQLH